MSKIGFVGCGNMGSAMIRGILNGKVAAPQDVCASAVSEKTKKKIREELGIQCAESNRAVADFADILFLAVKPQYYEEVLTEIAPAIRPEQIIVTIAPGKTLRWIEETLLEGLAAVSDVPAADADSAEGSSAEKAESDDDFISASSSCAEDGVNTAAAAPQPAEPAEPAFKIVRTMPNTPAMVGEGMTGVCFNENVTGDDLKKVVPVLESFGKAEVVAEKLLDVVTAVAGSSPAYVFMMIEAMADGAVADGMPRAQAIHFAAQAVKGSAEMVLSLGKHPAELKDMVCSPGGTTMEAVRVLEAKGLRSALIEAEKACVAKSRGM